MAERCIFNDEVGMAMQGKQMDKQVNDDSLREIQEFNQWMDNILA